MIPSNSEAINLALRRHQASTGDWGFRALTTNLHVWVERFVFDFKLDVGVPSLSIEFLRRNRLGHYRHGRNGFGLRDEIAIDQDHVCASPFWRVLETLLHELLHAWQERHGKPSCRNYHNKEFRDKAREFDLIVDQRGHSTCAPGDTLFRRILKQYGVDSPEVPAPLFTQLREPRSKLALWVCACGVKVRVGRSRFNATCLDCDGPFARA